MGYVLNLDILHNIMSFSDRTSTSRLMRTCKTLNHEGAKYLVMHNPWLWSEAGAVSFTQYVFARADVDEMVYRMHWLRSLQLNVPSWSSPESRRKFCRTMAFCLSHFVVHAPNFVELDLLTSENLFSADPGFAYVVCQMVRLQKLTLGDAGLQALKMLRHSSLRLSSAQICCIGDATKPSIDNHPIIALHNSQDTLRSLTLDLVAFDTSRPMPCYRNLVQLDYSSFLIPPIHHLASIFPNLHTLNVSADHGYSELEAPVREAHRQANILGQAQHGTFRALRSYTGSILSLYLFAITCRIPFLKLRDEDVMPCWDMRMLQAVCAQTRPTHLELHLSCFSDCPSEAEDLVRLLASEDLKSTRTLTLHFNITWWAKDVDMESILECAYSAVHGSSLRAVVLILDGQQFYDDYSEKEADRGASSPAENFMWSVDVEAVADQLFGTPKTLKTVIVHLWDSDEPEVKAQRGSDIDYSDAS